MRKSNKNNRLATKAAKKYTYTKGKKKMKSTICAVLGLAGSFIASLFGGWSAGLTTLLIFMAIDYCTGLIVAGVFHKSKKSEDGRLESKAGWKGLIRKGVSLLIVLVACRLDILLGVNYIRDATIIAFCANEALSLVENAGLMGVPMPAIITNAIELLQKNSEKTEDNDNA